MGIHIEAKQREIDPESVDRLIRETRQYKEQLEDITQRLSQYYDLNLLTIKGAIEYLIRHKKLLDDVDTLVRKSTNSVEHNKDTLAKIELLLDKSD